MVGTVLLVPDERRSGEASHGALPTCDAKGEKNPELMAHSRDLPAAPVAGGVCAVLAAHHHAVTPMAPWPNQQTSTPKQLPLQQRRRRRRHQKPLPSTCASPPWTLCTIWPDASQRPFSSMMVSTMLMPPTTMKCSSTRIYRLSLTMPMELSNRYHAMTNLQLRSRIAIPSSFGEM